MAIKFGTDGQEMTPDDRTLRKWVLEYDKMGGVAGGYDWLTNQPIALKTEKPVSEYDQWLMEGLVKFGADEINFSDEWVQEHISFARAALQVGHLEAISTTAQYRITETGRRHLKFA